ncbi:alpha/beta hydrolase [Sphingomonas sp. ID0503]|uniref:alpha/beta hydrolase n=1 Tax=Sphingomonas sp. ID0503 TaxID=3399691 RepID=UPI003AFB7546
MPASYSGERLLPASGGKPQQIVLLLHGFGSNAADMIGLASLWRAALPDTLFVAWNAPQPCHGAPGGFQWFGLHSFDRQALSAGVRHAATGLNAQIDALLAEHGLSEDRLLLTGFSQGTMMALHIALTRDRPVAGVAGYSGILADPLTRGVVSRPPILLIHGAADSVVPASGYHQTVRELRTLGLEVEAHLQPGLDHSVDPDGIARGLRFAQRVLPA